MRTQAPFVEWFRAHLDELPVELRGDVNFAISQNNARLIYIELYRLEKKFEFPVNWKDKILEYYYWIW